MEDKENIKSLEDFAKWIYKQAETKLIQEQELYFETARQLSELVPYANALCGADITKFKLADQIKVLQAGVKMNKVYKEMCEKYDIPVDVE